MTWTPPPLEPCENCGAKVAWYGGPFGTGAKVLCEFHERPAWDIPYSIWCRHTPERCSSLRKEQS